jgi:hypothetical protein
VVWFGRVGRDGGEWDGVGCGVVRWSGEWIGMEWGVVWFGRVGWGMEGSGMKWGVV